MWSPLVDDESALLWATTRLAAWVVMAYSEMLSRGPQSRGSTSYDEGVVGRHPPQDDFMGE